MIKMIKQLILILTFINIIFAQQEKEILKKVIESKLSMFPSMRETVNKFFPNIPNKDNYIHGNGFTKFAQSNDITKYETVPHDRLTDFLNYLVEMLEVLPTKRANVVRQLALTKYASTQQLVEHNLMFSIGNADCKFATILGIRNRDTSSTDWYVADIRLKFSLAPDLLILQSSKSAVWGLWQESKVTVQEIPQSITGEQMAILGQYFQIVTYQGFNDIININLRNRFLGEVAEEN